jgi:hypothetical protein
MLLNDLLRSKYPPFGIFATAVMMLEYSLVHAKVGEAAKPRLIDNIGAKLREAIEANRSEVSDTDIGKIMELGS